MALRVVRLTDALPRTRADDVMGRQLLRCATSVAANYRAARRARSTAEFVAKLGIVEEEADETLFWLEMLTESGVVRAKLVADLIREAGEITAMVVASIKTSRTASKRPKPLG